MSKSLKRLMNSVILVGFASSMCFAKDQQQPAIEIDKARIAHWTFDEPFGMLCRDASGNGHHAGAGQPDNPSVKRAEGLFGNAINLSDSHDIQVPLTLNFTTLPQISLSAWVMPRDLSGYREIFRKEDGNNRILFSFQGSGTILSLGLNIGGYHECDAKIDPQSVLDGRWHHCAATFDGTTMRVYLDGKEVGNCKRAGKIAAGGPEKARIASSRGGECFQGMIDELVIRSDTLTPQEIAAINRDGIEAMKRASEELKKRLAAVYIIKPTFAETVTGIRHKLFDSDNKPSLKLAQKLSQLLQTDFPDEIQRFQHKTRISLVQYLASLDLDVHVRLIEGLMELALEYKPLTEDQRARQTPEQCRQWKEIAEIKREIDDLKSRGDAERFSPRWIELMETAGAKIQFRPIARESVAPYQTPSTPPTRDLSDDEARVALERDWLHQADLKPTPERIRNEIAWTRQLAQRISGGHAEFDFADELRHLAELERRVSNLKEPDAELYFQVRRLKRAVMFRNPVLDFDKILLVDMPYPAGSEPRHETKHRLGYMAVPGARLLILDGLSPSGKLKQLMPRAPLHGSFWRPELSYNAEKVLFCFKPHNEKSFHLYEINVDGTGLRQLTDGPYDDLDPIYLPDDRHIIFSTTRGHTYVRCMPPTNAYVLARCDSDGKNIYLISGNNEPDYLPSVMHDGRIIYTRWEYTDKPLWRAQGLWTVNPDGTQVNTFWGNQTVWPDLLKDVRAIPCSRRVMFTGSAHHNWFGGSVGIIDPDRGYNFPDGLTKVTADVIWPESGNGPIDPIECASYHPSGQYHGYYSPYPLSETDFIVSADRGGKFVLYLMDVQGNRELIYEGTHNIFHAMPIRPRQKPPVIVDRVDWPSRENRLKPADGVIFSGNVYQGAPAELNGKAKFLRVLNIDPKTYTYWSKRPALSTGPVVSIVQSEGIKRVMGTVPIENDGSVSFRAPPGKALHFQLLDENYRALQTMRSFVNVMPGERRGCLGCHESHSRAPQPQSKAIALIKPARKITPPPWGVDTVSYERYVQPVLDKHCAKCHQGDGEAVKTFDQTPRPGFLGFAEPYFVMTGRPTWGSPYNKPTEPPPGFGIAGMLMVEGYSTVDPRAYKTTPPMTALSYKSPLIEIASSGKHHDVKVDPESLRRLILWVDTMCPYRGEKEVRAIDDPVFEGVDWLSIRPRIKTAPVIIRPGPVD
ncbi:MAG: hypothetical protein JXM70_15545 [Pirellulales bacterium]|nr:hypothetical protein [Pirellulales bacterium]